MGNDGCKERALRDLNVTPHIAQNTTNRTSAIDAWTTRHPGYEISQHKGCDLRAVCFGLVTSRLNVSFQRYRDLPSTRAQ
jgi:hypothetical protein